MRLGEPHCGSGIYGEEISCPLQILEPRFFGYLTRAMVSVLAGTVLVLRQNLHLSDKVFVRIKSFILIQSNSVLVY
jgi:hypothetical protein